MPALFLDRDGVINVRTPGEYVKTPDEFIPVAGLDLAIQILANKFDRIFVVTNQAGIGKGLMTELELMAVHHKMYSIIESKGGKIDRAYFCPHRSQDGCTCRKPSTGMAWQALADFPDIDFENSWMVGDSVADIEFGQSLGMSTVLIRGKLEEINLLGKMSIAYRFDTLLEFAHWISC